MENESINEAWRAHRPYLVNVAYQIVGDVGNAEDLVQEAFVRLLGATRDGIRDERGWLTVVTGRLCLDFLGSARTRRESSCTDADFDRGALLYGQPSLDPADRLTLDDAVGRALTEVLNRLSPGERVAFILHDVFGVPFDTIGEMTGRTPAGCRQLARRARTHLTHANLDDATDSDSARRDVIERFITACAGGNLQALAAVLDPAVWGVGTVVADPPLPQQINHGPHDVAANLMLHLGSNATLVSTPGLHPRLLAFADRRLFAVIVVTIRDGASRRSRLPPTRPPVSHDRRQPRWAEYPKTEEFSVADVTFSTTPEQTGNNTGIHVPPYILAILGGRK